MKKTLIFVGAYFYSNIGDDIYPIIIEKYLGKKYNLKFFNSDICDFDEYLKTADISDIRGIVFGGGGLLFDDGSAHLEYMKSYADFADAHNIPYGFISIGVQLVNPMNTDYFSTELRKWKPILEGAKFIYCRHNKDLRYFRKNLPRSIDMKHMKDLGYLMKGIIKESEALDTEEKYNILIYTSGVNNKKFLRKMKSQGADKLPLKVLLFSPENAPDDKHMIEFLGKFKSSNVIVYPISSPIYAASLIANASRIFTGRYHGLVMGRTYEKYCYFPDEGMPVKFYKEDDGTPEPAENNFTFVKHF